MIITDRTQMLEYNDHMDNAGKQRVASTLMWTLSLTRRKSTFTIGWASLCTKVCMISDFLACNKSKRSLSYCTGVRF